jgi:glutathione peroxidase
MTIKIGPLLVNRRPFGGILAYMRMWLAFGSLTSLLIALSACASTAPGRPLNVPIPTSIYQVSVTDIDGQTVPLSIFKGRLLLIVNTASYCGYTAQYAGLETIFERYRAQGLTVLAFPTNDFLNEEPGSSQQIKEFCTANYQASFPLFAKIKAVGPFSHPLYQWLTTANPRTAGPITWNFNKFLVSRNGTVLARFDSSVDPAAPEVLSRIEAAL